MYELLKEVKLKLYEQSPRVIRTITYNNGMDVLFAVRDAFKAFGFKNINQTAKRYIESKIYINVPTRGRNRYGEFAEPSIRKMRFLTEDELYDVIMSSRLQNAKEVRLWFRKVAIPTLRKDDIYEVMLNISNINM